MTNEDKLAALESATNELNACEYNYSIYGEECVEPFSYPPYLNPSGEVNVIYDKNGNVSHRVCHD